MVKWALYLDESGDSAPHSIPLGEGMTPVFTLGGVALPVLDWRDYDREFLRLKTQFFKNEIDKSRKDAPNWEFKGNRLIAPRNKDSERIKSFAYKVTDLIMSYGGELFAVSFLKDHINPTASHSMYTLALQVIAERYDIFLQETDEHGVIIIDSRMAHVTPGAGLDYRVATSFLSFLFGNAQGQQMKRLIEAPLFADSAITSGLQIADIIAAMLYANSYEHFLGVNKEKGFLDYSHTKKYWPPLKELEFASKKNYGGYQQFGHRVMDHRSKEAKSS